MDHTNRLGEIPIPDEWGKQGGDTLGLTQSFPRKGRKTNRPPLNRGGESNHSPKTLHLAPRGGIFIIGEKDYSAHKKWGFPQIIVSTDAAGFCGRENLSPSQNLPLGKIWAQIFPKKMRWVET